jgi:hypothetical protein
MNESKHISVFIRSTPRKIYDFARDPGNLPKWASGLGAAVEKVGEDWVADSPMGRIKVKFAPENPFGVLDHEVVLESGQKFMNPMRVVANGEGGELSFTLFRAPGMSEEAFLEDAATIAKDLNALKSWLEA